MPEASDVSVYTGMAEVALGSRARDREAAEGAE